MPMQVDDPALARWRQVRLPMYVSKRHRRTDSPAAPDRYCRRRPQGAGPAQVNCAPASVWFPQEGDLWRWDGFVAPRRMRRRLQRSRLAQKNRLAELAEEIVTARQSVERSAKRAGRGGVGPWFSQTGRAGADYREARCGTASAAGSGGARSPGSFRTRMISQLAAKKEAAQERADQAGRRGRNSKRTGG